MMTNDTLTVNGTEYNRDTFEEAASHYPGLAQQFLSENALGPQIRTDPEVARHFGQQYDGDRKIWEVLGYDSTLEADAYRAKYERQDIAERIVKIPAEDTWRYNPKVTDSPDSEENSNFDNQISSLKSNVKIFHYLRRTDIVTGIGEYGLLVIGVNDGSELSEPVKDGSLNSVEDIEFLSPFSQESVEEWTLGKEDGLEPTDERYNKPMTYRLDFADIDDSQTVDIRKVHHSRVIHVVDGADNSDLKGTPRLRSVYNRLQDLEKTVGASAEMFWSGADRKLHFNVDAEHTADISEEQKEELRSEVTALVHDMKQHIRTFNTDVTVIGGEEVDPSGVVDEILKFISGATGIPQRMLTGSERGELASSQDRATWYGRMQNRQNTFAEAMLLRPLIDKLQEWGILDDVEYEIEWPNLFELTELEQAQVVQSRAQALQAMAPQGNTDLLGTPAELFEYVEDGTIPEHAEEEEFPEFEDTQTPPGMDQVPTDDMTEESEEPEEDSESEDDSEE